MQRMYGVTTSCNSRERPWLMGTLRSSQQMCRHYCFEILLYSFLPDSVFDILLVRHLCKQVMDSLSSVSLLVV